MDRLASPGSFSAKYCRMGMPSLRQLLTTEKMAAIFGPAPFASQVRPVPPPNRDSTGILPVSVKN